MSDHICVVEITLNQAADRLGVTLRQAQRLAHAGRLQIVRRIGRSVLVDDSGVKALLQARRSPGRRWDVNTAWAAIEVLADGDTQRLSGSSLARLKARLRQVEVDELVRLAGNRAHVKRMTQTVGTPDDLRSALMLSGRSSLADAKVAQRFGLVAAATPVIEGYIHDRDYAEVAEWFGLEASAEGEVFLLVAPTHPAVSLVTVALDLLERGTSRERSAAVQHLEKLLAR